MVAPIFQDVSTSVTLNENSVNGTPAVLDGAVIFFDPDFVFDGGVLGVSGLLPEDRISILHEGFGAGMVGVVGNSVYCSGSVVGTLSGG